MVRARGRRPGARRAACRKPGPRRGQEERLEASPYVGQHRRVRGVDEEDGAGDAGLDLAPHGFAGQHVQGVGRVPPQVFAHEQAGVLHRLAVQPVRDKPGCHLAADAEAQATGGLDPVLGLERADDLGIPGRAVLPRLHRLALGGGEVHPAEHAGGRGRCGLVEESGHPVQGRMVAVVARLRRAPGAPDEHPLDSRRARPARPVGELGRRAAGPGGGRLEPGEQLRAEAPAAVVRRHPEREQLGRARPRPCLAHGRPGDHVRVRRRQHQQRRLQGAGLGALAEAGEGLVLQPGHGVAGRHHAPAERVGHAPRRGRYGRLLAGGHTPPSFRTMNRGLDQLGDARPDVPRRAGGAACSGGWWVRSGAAFENPQCNDPGAIFKRLLRTACRLGFRNQDLGFPPSGAFDLALKTSVSGTPGKPKAWRSWFSR